MYSNSHEGRQESSSISHLHPMVVPCPTQCNLTQSWHPNYNQVDVTISPPLYLCLPTLCLPQAFLALVYIIFIETLESEFVWAQIMCTHVFLNLTKPLNLGFECASVIQENIKQWWTLSLSFIWIKARTIVFELVRLPLITSNVSEGAWDLRVWPLLLGVKWLEWEVLVFELGGVHLPEVD